MKNVLILGCSHSRGSYSLSNTIRDKGEEYTAFNLGGWWAHCDYIKDMNKRIYAGGGVGWFWYAEVILSILESQTLKYYDMCIIQETIEPRFHISNQTECTKEKYKDFNAELIDFNVSVNSFFSNQFQNMDYIIKSQFPKTHISKDFYVAISGESNTYKTATYLSKLFVSNLMQEYQIPTYTFQMGDKVGTSDYFIDLELTNMYEKSTIKERTSDAHGAHLNIHGNKILGNKISNALRKKQNVRI